MERNELGKLVLGWQHGEDIEAACRELTELVVWRKGIYTYFNDCDDPKVSGGKILVNNVLHTYLNRNIHPLVVLSDHVWVLWRRLPLPFGLVQ